MPASRDTRRLVTYVDVAEEIARRAQVEGRTVSGWLARLIAEALPTAPDPEPPSPAPPKPPAPFGSGGIGGWKTRPSGARRPWVPR